jgi:hypothetical protein
MKKFVLAAAAATFSFAAFAQMPPYAQLDTNTDGMVSPEEAKAGMPDMTDEMWTKADANGDKMLSNEEYSTMMEGK